KTWSAARKICSWRLPNRRPPPGDPSSPPSWEPVWEPAVSRSTERSSSTAFTPLPVPSPVRSVRDYSFITTPLLLAGLFRGQPLPLHLRRRREHIDQHGRLHTCRHGQSRRRPQRLGPCPYAL